MRLREVALERRRLDLLQRERREQQRRARVRIAVGAEHRSTGLLEIDAGFDHYGSGYASYVHLSCQKPNGRSRARRDNADWIDGVAIYLSRLTPFAIYGSEHRTISAATSSRTFLDLNRLYILPPGDWQNEITAIRRTLESLGFSFPPRDELAELLPFEADIPTILDDVHVYGAVFYWED